MQVIRIPTANGVDDIKLIGQTPLERQFIKQLAEAGTLSSISRSVADSVVFRPISVNSATGGSGTYASHLNIGKYDFELRQNENHVFSLSFADDLGNPRDLSVYTTIKLQVKPRKGASSIVDLILAAGLVVSGADHNILTVSFTEVQTALMTSESYYYDILMSTANSNIYLIEGKITTKFTGTR